MTDLAPLTENEVRYQNAALADENKTLREALEAVDSEIALEGQLKELVDAALAYGEQLIGEKK